MIKTSGLVFRAIIALVMVLGGAQACKSHSDHLVFKPSDPYYKITIDENNVRKVQVEASFPVLRDTLYMSKVMSDELEEGYATFVHSLQATDDKGNPIDLTPLGKSRWKVSGDMPMTIHLKYNVEIGHDKVHWNVSGAFARAYAADDALFFTGRTVFIAAKGSDSSKIHVHFDLPKGWDLATPYYSTGTNEYEAKNLSDLWFNGNYAGHLIQQQINVGKLQVIIAGSPSVGDGVGLIKDNLAKIVNFYNKEMGGAPEGKLVIAGTAAPLMPGGEAFSRSISVVFYQKPHMNNKAAWGYLLSHEIFHLWNGHTINPANQSQVEWFVEGFTDYMAKMAAFRVAFNSEAEFMQQLSGSCNNYLQASHDVSMFDAGTNKGANYMLIYNGGMATALVLDIQCRKATKNKYGFFEIMRRMYTRYGLTGTPYKYHDIIKVSSEVSGTDMSGFFADYVAGTKMIPLETYLNYAGLQIDNQTSVLTRKPNAPPGEKELLNAVLHK